MTYAEIDALDPVARVAVRDAIRRAEHAEIQRDQALEQVLLVQAQKDRIWDELVELRERSV